MYVQLAVLPQGPPVCEQPPAILICLEQCTGLSHSLQRSAAQAGKIYGAMSGTVGLCLMLGGSLLVMLVWSIRAAACIVSWADKACLSAEASTPAARAEAAHSGAALRLHGPAASPRL